MEKDSLRVNFFQTIKNFYRKYIFHLFLSLSGIYFLGSSFRLTNNYGCNNDMSAYVFQYLIVILIPFLITYFCMMLESGRNKLIGKELSSGPVYSLHTVLMTIFFLAFLFIDCVAFFTGQSCEKLGDDYSWLIIFIAFGLACIYGAYLLIMLLIWIIRFLRK